jgi:hypothetical protein
VVRRVRPAVLRQRIATRLDREYSNVAGSDDELWTASAWRQGYLAGLRVARVIVREGGR